MIVIENNYFSLIEICQSLNFNNKFTYLIEKNLIEKIIYIFMELNIY